MKKRLADGIEQYIKALIARSEQRQIEIQRSELAETFGCAPSQVTYVLGTRFTSAHGYRTESHRGGRGFIRIKEFGREEEMPAGQEILLDYLDNLFKQRYLSEREAHLLRYMVMEIAVELPREYERQVHNDIAAALERFFQVEEKREGGI
ncbi:MAG: CtsR family transcriptional regulator [Syntrophomonadaceae bacterium]|nr:CtsR family transcriptional regulator [Syntrophomonadaceae bacterium]